MSTTMRVRLLSAVIIGAGLLSMPSSAAAEAGNSECTTEEWIMVADAIADYCIGQGYTGGQITSCENLGNGIYETTAGCTLDI